MRRRPASSVSAIPSMDGGGVGAGAARGEGEWLRAYGRLTAILPRVEALAAGRARLEAINGMQHEFWEARDVLLQCRLLQADQSRRRWEAAYMALQPSGDDPRFRELQQSDLEDLTTFVDVLDAENMEFKIKVKEVEGGVEHSPNTADHDHVARDLKAGLRQLKQAYEAFCSEKDKEVSELVAEKDFVREQFRTLERDYGNLQQNVEQLRVASQKKDDEIHRLRARAKAAQAKRKLVPEGNAQETCCMPKETDVEIEKRKYRQPGTSQKLKKDMPETNTKNCSEVSALRGETKMCSSKQMLAEDGQPGTSQKRKCVTFLSNDDEQTGNDEETSNQVLEPVKKKRMSGRREVEQGNNKAELAYLGATRSVFEKAVGVLSQGLQGARDKNDHLAEVLGRTEERLNTALAEVEQVKTFTRDAHAAEALGHLERDLKQAHEDLLYTESLRQASQHALSRRREDSNALRAENARQAQEIETLKAQLAAAEAKNRQTSEAILASLTGQPLEAPGLLPEDAATRLAEVHESARASMKVVFKALWPEEEHVPEDMAILAERLKRARHRIQAWKVSACREGAREAWAMVKTRYTKVDTAHLAEVGPIGPDGEEIPTSLAYANVMPAARFSQKDCTLDTLIDGLDRA